MSSKTISVRNKFAKLAEPGLAVWRVTDVLGAGDSPWEVLERLRGRLGSGTLRSLFDCFYCLTIWVVLAFVFAFGETWRTSLLLWPALSAAAILLERMTKREQPADAARLIGLALQVRA